MIHATIHQGDTKLPFISMDRALAFLRHELRHSQPITVGELEQQRIHGRKPELRISITFSACK